MSEVNIQVVELHKDNNRYAILYIGDNAYTLDLVSIIEDGKEKQLRDFLRRILKNYDNPDLYKSDRIDLIEGESYICRGDKVLIFSVTTKYSRSEIFTEVDVKFVLIVEELMNYLDTISEIISNSR